MTIPASGVVDATDVSSELGIATNSRLELNDRRVRAFPGIQAGLIAYSNLRGRSRVSWSATINSIQWQTDSTIYTGFAIAASGVAQNGSLSNTTLNGMPIAQLYVSQNKADPTSCAIQVNFNGLQSRPNVNRIITLSLGGIVAPVNLYWDYVKFNGNNNTTKSDIRPYAQSTITQAQYNTIRTAILNKSSTAAITYAT